MKPQDIEELRQLIEFLKAHQVAEFDLDRGDVKIRLKFQEAAHSSPGLADLARALGSVPTALGQAPSATASAAAASPTAVPAEDLDAGLHFVQSPMVGTFYASPSPGAASFVSSGDYVEKGQVICIIEAMKLMNEIESDTAGEIVRCLVTNGQPIEFGQRLFAIRPA